MKHCWIQSSKANRIWLEILNDFLVYNFYGCQSLGSNLTVCGQQERAIVYLLETGGARMWCNAPLRLAFCCTHELDLCVQTASAQAFMWTSVSTFCSCCDIFAL